MLDPSKDNSRVIVGNGGLHNTEWQLLHRCRLYILPLHAYPWSSGDNKSCPRCFIYVIAYVLFGNQVAVLQSAYPNIGGSSLPMDNCFGEHDNYSERNE